MNTYNLHINLYDLGFLGAIFVGLTFAVLLLFTKSGNRGSKQYLGLALVVMVLEMVRLLGIDIRIGNNYPNWISLPLQFSLALGPLIYFYVLKITRTEYKFRSKDMLHFSPLWLELGSQALEVTDSIKSGIATYDTLTFHELNPILQLLAFISVAVYLYWSYRLIQDFYQRTRFTGGDRYRYGFRWLEQQLAGFGLLWLLSIPFTAADYFYYHYQLSRQAYYPLYLFLAAMTIWMAAEADLRPDAGQMVAPLARVCSAGRGGGVLVTV